jgi:hypothetical protein
MLLNQETIQQISPTPGEACGDTQTQRENQTTGNTDYHRPYCTAMHPAGNGADL